MQVLAWTLKKSIHFYPLLHEGLSHAPLIFLIPASLERGCSSVVERLIRI